MTKRFSLEEQIFVKKDGTYQYLPTSQIDVGDYMVIKNAEQNFAEQPVTNITYLDEERTVYKFDAGPIDTLIAGDMLVHNGKLF